MGCARAVNSLPPLVDGRSPEARHVEVKGPALGADTITVNRNNVLYALNQASKFWLAKVLVAEDDSAQVPYYIPQPLDAAPGWGVASLDLELKAHWARGRGR